MKPVEYEANGQPYLALPNQVLEPKPTDGMQEVEYSDNGQPLAALPNQVLGA